jgi:vacuolar protein sorting-associated protein 41
MAEESDNQDEIDKGKGKELNQDEEGTQDETDSAADSGTEDEEEDDEDDDEPKLKYARLTSQLGSVYRNGDAMSAFLVAGDKMVGLGHHLV